MTFVSLCWISLFSAIIAQPLAAMMNGEKAKNSEICEMARGIPFIKKKQKLNCENLHLCISF